MCFAEHSNVSIHFSTVAVTHEKDHNLANKLKNKTKLAARSKHSVELTGECSIHTVGISRPNSWCWSLVRQRTLEPLLQFWRNRTSELCAPSGQCGYLGNQWHFVCCSTCIATATTSLTDELQQYRLIQTNKTVSHNAHRTQQQGVWR